MYNFGDPRLQDCTFEGNAADVHGGAIFNSGADPELINCALNGNVAGADDNAVVFVWPDGEIEELPTLPKRDVAAQLFDRVAKSRGGCE